jgi:hypothetical protein
VSGAALTNITASGVYNEAFKQEMAVDASPDKRLLLLGAS